MAKDDFHVIVWQILSYLYKQLKKGNKVDAECISAESPYYSINEQYWAFIMESLGDKGYIRGIKIQQANYINGKHETNVTELEKCKITMDGIEYLTTDGLMRKVRLMYEDKKTYEPLV